MMNRLSQAAERVDAAERAKGNEGSFVSDALFVAAVMFDAVFERADEQAQAITELKTRLTALEAKAAPAPELETVTISKAAFNEAIKVLTLVLGNLDDEPYATTNRLIHAIGVLKGDINPLPF